MFFWDIHLFCNLQANPEKPKRPISAMFIFSEEKRPKLQQERPDLSDSELTRLLARMWNELPDKKKVTSYYVSEKRPVERSTGARSC